MSAEAGALPRWRELPMPAHIREICLLGLPAVEVVQRVVPQVGQLLGAPLAAFSWVDDRLEITNHFLADPAFSATAASYFEHFYNRRERGAIPAYSEMLRRRTPLLNTVSVERSMLGSELFNDLMKPSRIRHALRVVVQAEKVYGTLTVGRGFDGRPFSPAEEGFMGQVARWLAHAFITDSGAEPDYSEEGEEGLLLIDAQGRVLHLCDTARRLAFLLVNPEVAPGRDWHAEGAARLARQFATAMSGERSAAPPCRRFSNRWGRFTLRGRWLTAPGGEEQAVIGVSLRRALPLAVRLLERMEGLPLSERERQVCLLLAEGRKQEEIAERLGITAHTVTTHVRRIYEKTGTRQRDGLLRRLLLRVAGSPPGAEPRGSFPAPGATAHFINGTGSRRF